jgi:hypothetical protein
MIMRSVLVISFAVSLSVQAAPIFAQGSLALVIEPYAGSEERERERVSEEFGRTMRITGFEDGEVLAEPFEGRVLLMRFRNPEDRSTF